MTLRTRFICWQHRKNIQQVDGWLLINHACFKGLIFSKMIQIAYFHCIIVGVEIIRYSYFVSCPTGFPIYLFINKDSTLS